MNTTSGESVENNVSNVRCSVRSANRSLSTNTAQTTMKPIATRNDAVPRTSSRAQ